MSLMTSHHIKNLTQTKGYVKLGQKLIYFVIPLKKKTSHIINNMVRHKFTLKQSEDTHSRYYNLSR